MNEELVNIDLVLTTFLRRKQIYPAEKGYQGIIDGSIFPKDFIAAEMKKFPIEDKIIRQNCININHRLTPQTSFDCMIAIYFLRTGKIAIEKENTAILRKDINNTFYDYDLNKFTNFDIPNFKEKSIMTYFANLYSIPIPFPHMKKIESQTYYAIMRSRENNYDTMKALGKKRCLSETLRWMQKYHEEVITKMPELDPYANINSTNTPIDETILALINVCYEENRNRYKSKAAIAKKLYNFRANSLKNRYYTDDSKSVRLQVQIHISTMAIIKNYADEKNMKINEALENLVRNGLYNINYGPGEIIEFRQSPPTTRYDY